MLSEWVDLLWFDSLGYGAVFWRTLLIQLVIFAGATAVTFLILYGAFSMIRLSHEADLPADHAIVVGGQRFSLSVAPALRFISLAVSAAVALLTGFVMMENWPTLALLWYAPHNVGEVADSLFGRPLRFFLFTLPAWRLMDGWLLTLALATCAVAVLFLVITSGSRTRVDCGLLLRLGAESLSRLRFCCSCSR